MALPEINYFAVVIAAAASFMLGGLWYGPLFLGPWQRHAGDTRTQAQKHPARVFGISYLFALISAFVFALWLGPTPPLQDALLKGLGAGAGLVAASFGINYQFANRSTVLWLIDGGYHVAQFLIYGLVLGLWH